MFCCIAKAWKVDSQRYNFANMRALVGIRVDGGLGYLLLFKLVLLFYRCCPVVLQRANHYKVEKDFGE